MTRHFPIVIEQDPSGVFIGVRDLEIGTHS